MENDNNQQKTITAKVYKLYCDDGHFYYGSTTQKYLSSRYAVHKEYSFRDEAKNNKVYSHIHKIGWDRVKIILVEEFKCTSREDMRRKENEHIVKDLNNPLCLNYNRSFVTDTQRLEKIYERKRKLSTIAKTIVKCECGLETTNGRREQHTNSFKHRSRMEKQKCRIIDDNPS